MSSPVLPVARVVVDVSLPHLDRPFDYAVPADLDAAVVPGCRVKVRFSGRVVDGLVVERVADSDHPRLAPITKVVSSEPVLTPAVLALARSVADRYAGTTGDVLRLAIPPRHARAEKAPRPERLDLPSVDVAPAEGRAVWTALPTDDVPRRVAELAAATAGAGRGVVVCVPDQRDVDRWSATFTDVLGAGRYVVLTASLSPERRYRAFLALSRGDVSVVLGTRGAAYAPVPDLGLAVVWDDGDDLHAEPRSPSPHTREVLLLRSMLEGSAVVLASYARSVEAQSLVDSGFARDVSADAVARRAAWPRVALVDASESGQAPVRLPTAVVRAIRDADGPVLLQVPRRGYRSALTCQSCRTPARCTACEGRLAQLRGGADPVCRWCGHTEPWLCRECGGRQLRAPVVGHVRTAEEVARTFPGRTVVTSGGDTVVDEVTGADLLVLATPGAEPVAAGGYALVVLLDTWLMLARDDVRVVEESARRWFAAMALAAGRGSVLAVGDHPVLQALVRADPAGVAERELAERAATHLPPVGRLAVVEAPSAVVGSWAAATWTPHTEVLGPVPVDDGVERLVLRAPRAEGAALAGALRDRLAERSAAKQDLPRVRIDPLSW